MKRLCKLLTAVAVFTTSVTLPTRAVTPADSTFTYQGRLNDGGAPAHGAFDLRFTLYDSAQSGNLVGAPLTHDDVGISNGVFTTSLDFGPAAFNGDARWLEIAVRHGTNTGAFTTLNPRQPIHGSPYALYAMNARSVAWNGIVGVPAAVTNTADGSHFGQAWLGSNSTGGLDVRNAGSGTGVIGRQGGGSGWGSSGYAGVFGDSGTGDGVVGVSPFRGVWGYALGNGENYGVAGYSASPLGTGVYGKAGSSTGGTGVSGETAAATGSGVHGKATALTGVNAGVSGRASSPQGIGVFGFATNVTGATRGMHGVSQSPQGIGVLAENTAGEVALKANGKIQSTADSFIFYPAWTMKPGLDSTWYLLTAEPYPDAEYPIMSVPYYTSDDWYAVVPLTLPGLLYGQKIRLKEITIYYETLGVSTRIARTIVRAQGENVLNDVTPRSGNGSYTVTFPNGGYQPATDQGYFLNLWLVLDKNSNTDNADGRFIFRGAKMRVEHD